MIPAVQTKMMMLQMARAAFDGEENQPPGPDVHLKTSEFFERFMLNLEAIKLQ